MEREKKEKKTNLNFESMNWIELNHFWYWIYKFIFTYKKHRLNIYKAIHDIDIDVSNTNTIRSHALHITYNISLLWKLPKRFYVLFSSLRIFIPWLYLVDVILGRIGTLSNSLCKKRSTMKIPANYPFWKGVTLFHCVQLNSSFVTAI